ncbi:hypothetical protein ACKFKF_15150 [Phormidesmis sp. 146-12]
MHKSNHIFSRSRLLKYVFSIGILLVSAFVTAGIFFSITASTQAQSSIPPTVNSCIPKNQVARSELIGTTESQGRRYYLLAAYEQGDPIASDLVISVVNNKCERKLYNPTGDRLSLASAVPQMVARQLTLQRYQREIRRIGQSAFEKQVDRAQSHRWFDEEVWALQRLRIPLRKTPN